MYPMIPGALEPAAVLVIPAYEPSHSLPGLIAATLAAGGRLFRAVVLVDDGSSSACSPVFEAASRDARVHLVRHAVNLGKGAALKTGLNYALVRWPNAVALVTADADGQHAPEDIVRVAEAAAASPGKLVVGTREFSGQVPLRSQVGNVLTRMVLRVFAGMSVADTQTGLRAWPLEYCRDCLKIISNGYDYELECLLAFKSRYGAHSIVQVPIRTIYTDGNRSSHFNPVFDSMRVYFVFLRYCASALLAAVTDSLVFYSLYRSGAGVAASQVAGRACAVIAAFLLARNMVFQARGTGPAALAKYLALVVAMGAVSYTMIQFLHFRFGWPMLVSKLSAEGLLFLGNFAIQREFIFVVRPRAARAEAASDGASAAHP
jgi:glycosyltransferase involved in cell wall biosynthesis